MNARLDAALAMARMPFSVSYACAGGTGLYNARGLLARVEAELARRPALTYLFLAAKNGVPVVSYTDDAEGRLGIVDGKMRMSRVTLRPRIMLEAGADDTRARELVTTEHDGCFIANSVSTPVDIEPAFAFTETPAAR